MKPPTIIFKKYRIRYRQSSWGKRFFLVDIMPNTSCIWDKEFMRIESFHIKRDLPLWEVFGFFQSELMVGHNFAPRTYTRLVAFMNRAKQYDDYLDGKE